MMLVDLLLCLILLFVYRVRIRFQDLIIAIPWKQYDLIVSLHSNMKYLQQETRTRTFHNRKLPITSLT